jgi:hypothetical protein
LADLGPSFSEKSYIGNKKDGIKTGCSAIDLKSHPQESRDVVSESNGPSA